MLNSCLGSLLLHTRVVVTCERHDCQPVIHLDPLVCLLLLHSCNLCCQLKTSTDRHVYVSDDQRVTCAAALFLQRILVCLNGCHRVRVKFIRNFVLFEVVFKWNHDEFAVIDAHHSLLALGVFTTS